jgi:hypothetical protein
VTAVGVWLLARLACHWHYNSAIPKNRQQPLIGLGLSDTDWLKIVHLKLELSAMHQEGPTSCR